MFSGAITIKTNNSFYFVLNEPIQNGIILWDLMRKNISFYFVFVQIKLQI